MLSEYLHAIWAVFGVVIVAELLRQRWWRNRCRVLAEQNKAEKNTHSHEHAIADRAITRIRELANDEAFARVVAFGVKVAVFALAVAWLYVVGAYVGVT